jgi:Dyp-type peroxidase family
VRSDHPPSVEVEPLHDRIDAAPKSAAGEVGRQNAVAPRRRSSRAGGRRGRSAGCGGSCCRREITPTLRWPNHTGGRDVAGATLGSTSCALEEGQPQHVSIEPTIALDLEDIQAGALQSRPTPYAGVYLGLRIDDRQQGRELLRRLIPLLDSVADFHPEQQVSIGVALTFAGLGALGVPAASLASFPPEFREGMAARADLLGDVGENAPEHWEQPFATGEIHVVIAGLAPSSAVLEPRRVLAERALRDLAGIVTVWHEEVSSEADGRNWFGFRDSISQPTIEGTGIAGTNPHEVPSKPGEFVLGYETEMGPSTHTPEPAVLGRNGTYVAFRKLHMRVAAFRQYLRDQAKDRADEELLAAKMIGRWPSGAPLALCPHEDDPELGADPARNNAFMYGDDLQGLKTPTGCHARRTSPRDAKIVGEARLHRMIRRGMNYGPPLADGVLEDDGAERGLLFAFVGAHLARQFEFVQKQWIDDGGFIGASAEKDPLVGHNDDGRFTIPNQPIRRRVRGLPAFVVNRGGEYGFMPGLRALRWIADLDT